MKYLTLTGSLLATLLSAQAQIAPGAEIPASLNHLTYDASNRLTVQTGGQTFTDTRKEDDYKLPGIMGVLTGTETGILLNLHRPGFNGTVAYGPLDETAEYPAIAFLPRDARISDGKALLEMKKTFTKATDYFHLADQGKGILGYRIIDSTGRIIYEGRTAFEGKGPYQVVPTITQGPMVNTVEPNQFVLAYETQVAIKTTVTVDGRTFSDDRESTRHELPITGLKPSTEYTYTITYGARTESHKMTTAPAKGSRQPFTFAFASANRATTGGGERDFGGTNYQHTRAVMAAAMMNKAAFLQCTGDFTNGANTSEGGHLMEYANFKRALEPFWSRIPVYVGMGDHETNKTTLRNQDPNNRGYSVELFPYAEVSGEATFAKAFVNPANGPQSEDGAAYDPNPNQMDFPTYKENVYSYTYGNIAMIVLNTEYWESKTPAVTGGCPEGYIMDQQMKWLRETVQHMENDPDIDHIFVNIHGAVFPNGDHLTDAMYWSGDNTSRAVVAGVGLPKGAIERRDEIIDACVNKSKKFLAFISGDEHNFSFLEVTPATPIYKDGYTGPKIRISRPFYNINNGGGGAAPYAMLKSPWSGLFKYFTPPPSVALITVSGKKVVLKAVHAETLEPICQDIQLR
ncbi:MAG TPA: hypothetical protein VGN00_05505 [Puia sp.]|jgi:hypothetical protein